MDVCGITDLLGGMLVTSWPACGRGVLNHRDRDRSHGQGFEHVTRTCQVVLGSFTFIVRVVSVYASFVCVYICTSTYIHNAVGRFFHVWLLRPDGYVLHSMTMTASHLLRKKAWTPLDRRASSSWATFMVGYHGPGMNASQRTGGRILSWLFRLHVHPSHNPLPWFTLPRLTTPGYDQTPVYDLHASIYCDPMRIHLSA